MDRNAILDGYVSSFSDFSRIDIDESTEVFNTSSKVFDDYGESGVEKVLKFSGNNFDIRKRADIKREVVVFKLLNGSTDYRLDDEKPSELNQRFQALVYIEQPDSHSLKDTIYDRALQISDQLFNWATQTTASDINIDLYTLTLLGVDSIEERDGYLSTVVNFESIIRIS